MATTEMLDLERLRRSFGGILLTAADRGYDQARRVWNGAIDRRPAVIARCRGTSDIVAAVRFAREQGLTPAVRGGGHNVAGNATCDGGILIDLSPMKSIRVHPRARAVQAQPGVLWGEFDRATRTFGLAGTGGIQSTTGIAGFTLGGGIGWLSRKHGHACDNLLSARIVTADGTLVAASPHDNEDLFFGIRGGGGNFGIAASFEFRLHPLERVVGGMVWHPAERTAEAVAFFRDWTSQLPDELGTILFVLSAPNAPQIPHQLRARPAVAIGVCYAGDPDTAKPLLAPLRGFGPPAADLIRPQPYPELQVMVDAANPPHHQCYWKAEYLGELSDDAIAAIAEHSAAKPAGLSKVLLTRLGGAAGRIAEDATAFSHRGAPYIININGMGPDPARLDQISGWARDLWDALQPFSYGGTYVNFLGEEGQDRVRAAYGEQKYERLVQLKRKYDPSNAFRLNQNITPT